MSKSEYMQFFKRWIEYQFPRANDEINNLAVLKAVDEIVADCDELAHWANRDCWSMFDYAKGK